MQMRRNYETCDLSSRAEACSATSRELSNRGFPTLAEVYAEMSVEFANRAYNTRLTWEDRHGAR